ncbi:MAG: hypothetical protein ACE5HE_03865 [Phycisphaerae bacterium]
MPLSEGDSELLYGFLAYIEGSVEGDDRYGRVSRVSNSDGSTIASRFEAGPHGWLEVAVHAAVPSVRVAYLTLGEALASEVEQAIRDAAGTPSAHISESFREAGLDWPDPPVEHGQLPGEYSYFATSLDIDDLGDLDFNDVRGKVVRMLEGYLIAFGADFIFDDAEDE